MTYLSRLSPPTSSRCGLTASTALRYGLLHRGMSFLEHLWFIIELTRQYSQDAPSPSDTHSPPGSVTVASSSQGSPSTAASSFVSSTVKESSSTVMPTNDEVEAVIKMATSTKPTPDGRPPPGKDTRTQLFVGNVSLPRLFSSFTPFLAHIPCSLIWRHATNSLAHVDLSLHMYTIRCGVMPLSHVSGSKWRRDISASFLFFMSNSRTAERGYSRRRSFLCSTSVSSKY